MESGKRGKKPGVIALVIAMVMQAAVVILMPFAKQYAQEQFRAEPMYLLRYVLRPFAQVLFGWAIVEAGRELIGIRIWEGKPESTRRIVRVVFYVLAVCLTVAAVLTLWMGAETAYQYYLQELSRIRSGSVTASMSSHIISDQLGYLILFYYIDLDRMGFDNVFLLLGAALAVCRVKKEKSEKEA